MPGRKIVKTRGKAPILLDFQHTMFQNETTEVFHFVTKNDWPPGQTLKTNRQSSMAVVACALARVQLDV